MGAPEKLVRLASTKPGFEKQLSTTCRYVVRTSLATFQFGDSTKLARFAKAEWNSLIRWLLSIYCSERTSLVVTPIKTLAFEVDWSRFLSCSNNFISIFKLLCSRLNERLFYSKVINAPMVSVCNVQNQETWPTLHKIWNQDQDKPISSAMHESSC